MRINIRKAGPLIATGLACAGVIVTALLAVKKAPEVQEAVEDARLERGGDLKPLEVVKAAAPSAWPVCAVAAGTIACIVGIQAMNQKQQASLVAMYGVAAKSLRKYDSKIKELFGENAPAKVKTAIAQDTADETHIPNPVGDACLFYDMISGRYFTSTMLAVRDAEYHFNRNFVLRGGQAVLNELYDFLGLDHIEGGDIAGWDVCEIGEFYGYEWIDFDHEKVRITGDDGNEFECYILSCSFPPCYLDMKEEFDPIEFECAEKTALIYEGGMNL